MVQLTAKTSYLLSNVIPSVHYAFIYIYLKWCIYRHPNKLISSIDKQPKSRIGIVKMMLPFCLFSVFTTKSNIAKHRSFRATRRIKQNMKTIFYRLWIWWKKDNHSLSTPNACCIIQSYIMSSGSIYKKYLSQFLINESSHMYS